MGKGKRLETWRHCANGWVSQAPKGQKIKSLLTRPASFEMCERNGTLSIVVGRWVTRTAQILLHG
jgi:hypothetical protein